MKHGSLECPWISNNRLKQIRLHTDSPTNFWLFQLSSSHSVVTMCLTTDTAVRNFTVLVTLLATRWVHFWELSATSPPRSYNFCSQGGERKRDDKRMQGRASRTPWGLLTEAHLNGAIYFSVLSYSSEEMSSWPFYKHVRFQSFPAALRAASQTQCD